MTDREIARVLRQKSDAHKRGCYRWKLKDRFRGRLAAELGRTEHKAATLRALIAEGNE